MVELVVVVAIMLIVAAFATPNILSMMHSARLQGTASDFTGLIQQARIRSVQDDRAYSLVVNPAAGATPSTAFVDLQQTGVFAAGDPEMLLPTEVTLVAAVGAPGAANLKTQLLPAASPVMPQDAASAAATPITFSPRGLPCTPVAGACNGAGLGAAAYWAFFQDSQTTNWEAVTISPAGRIQKWSYSAAAAAWNKM
jgi:Tfp pilus assembly protein FimT